MNCVNWKQFIVKYVYLELKNYDKLNNHRYLQQLDFDVFKCSFYFEESFRLLVKLIKQDRFLSLYIDATGSVIKKIENMEKKPFYYCLSVKGSF